MAVSLNLQEIQDLADGGAYAGTYTLSDSTVALVLSWLALLFHWNWKGVGYSLTSAEIDTIDDMIAEALTELMGATEGNGVEIGTVVAYAGDALPEKYLWCDGNSHEKVDYPDLYDALDDVFIIDFAYFKTPLLTAKFPLGLGDYIGGSYAMGDVGGEIAVTLAEDELPEHTHGIETLDYGAETQTAKRILRYNYTLYSFLENTGAVGSDVAHENMPPFQALNYIIYAGV